MPRATVEHVTKAHVNRGVCYIKKGEIDKAMTDGVGSPAQ